MRDNEQPQTGDPGENHTHSDEKITGMVDFSGQDQYDVQDDDTPPGELHDGRVDIHGGMSPAKYTRLDNPCNGSGGTSKTIAPDKVKGSNP